MCENEKKFKLYLGNNEFSQMTERIGLREFRKSVQIKDLRVEDNFFKIKIKGMTLETKDYSEKFGRKNCFLHYLDRFYQIIGIKKICNTFELQCLSIITEQISLNTFRVLNFSDESIIFDHFIFRKVVPIFVNNKLYLAKRPNEFLNE